MKNLLHQYRSQNLALTPEEFWQYISDASVLYLHDPDTSQKSPIVRESYNPKEAEEYAKQHYAPFWPLNVFTDKQRREEYFLSTAALGIDVDVVTTAEFSTISIEEIDRRKNTVLEKLKSFPIPAHETHETPKGLHIVFLVTRVQGKEGLRLFKEGTELLIEYFSADKGAGLVTQVLRFPNSLHFKRPAEPFRCQCLIDRLDDLPAHDLHKFVGALRTLPIPVCTSEVQTFTRTKPKAWQEGVQGVLEGSRNTTAASVAGKLLHDLPREMWETGGWGGLKEWNSLNPNPLTEKELRGTFKSIVARELRRRKEDGKTLDSRFHTYPHRENREIENPAFTLQSIGDFLAEPEENINWVVQDLLPAGGFSLCAAKPKVGKSTEVRNLLRCIARGEPYLGRPTTQGKVLYFAFEEKRGEVRKQFSQMGLRPEDQILLYVGSAPTRGLEALTKAIADHKPVFAAVDPLFLLLPVKEINDYAELLKTLDPLRSLARETGCHIEATHHLNKMGGSGGDGVLGSTAIFGTVDTLIQMRKKDDGRRIIHTIQRYGIDLPETVLELDRVTGITVPLGALETLNVKNAESDVLDAIGNEMLIEPEIKKRTGGNQTVTARAIRSLVDAGTLIRSGGGVSGSPYSYRLAGYVDDAATNEGKEGEVSVGIQQKLIVSPDNP